MKNRYQRYAAILVTLIFIGSMTQVSGRIVGGIPYGDKLVHFSVFGLVGTLLYIGFDPKRPGRAWIAIGIAWLIGATDESMHYFNPHRDFEWLDMAANFLGAGVAVVLCASSEFFRKLVTFPIKAKQ